MEDYEPIHQEVWNKLDSLATEVFQLKRANSKLKNEIRRIRKERDKYRKELYPPKQNYINIQKGRKK